MKNESDSTPPENAPEDLDEGLAYAYGEDSQADGASSVIERIGEVSGSMPRVLLRDESAGDTPMLKPLGPDERVEAGKYVVQGELGRGGVGTVHKGHDQDLGRDVAMKFLHDKYKDQPAILHRFVEEAQIGGQLQHPGIVPVYDLGMVDGKPFFAMKLVKGQTLAKKLAERESPASDRRTFLSIFEDVCQTLAYAHARGVVHRDLKPANIMIGSFGEVQVVDWGMGKVLQSGGVADEKLAAERQSQLSVIETVRSGGHGSQSIVGSVMGTPAYMPPEQARGDVEHMDERSDVFALGAILCEILTGAPPYVGEQGDLIAMAAMARLDDAHARLEACGGEPEMVELATRCLMPAPAARPKSAEVVAKTVHDHLAAVESRVHEARVEAAEAKVRAASLKRTQKLGIGLTVAITAGLIASLWFWRTADEAATNEKLAKLAAVASAKEAQDNEQRAVEQTEVAERELARAVEIKRLITEMLQSIDPEQAKGADITLLKGILDTASKRLAEDAIEDELVAAELHALTGKVYGSIGLYPAAEGHLPTALEIAKRLLGDEHPKTLGAVTDLAYLYVDQGRHDEAETLYLQTLEIMKRVLGEEHPHTLTNMSNLAAVYLAQGRYDEAEPLCLQTLEVGKRTLGEEHPQTLPTMNHLAILYDNQGRYADAETLYLQTLEISKRVLGEEHPRTVQSMGNLASLYNSQGRYADAETLFLQTLEIKKRVLGEEHPTTLLTMVNLATLYSSRGRYADAETLHLQTLEIEKRVLGEEHPHTLVSTRNLATLYLNQGRYDEAETLFLQTLEIEKRMLGEEHPSTLGSMNNLANLYQSQGRYDEAETLYLQTLEITKRVLGDENPHTLRTMANLANLYQRQGRSEEAEPLFLQTLELTKRVQGDEHPGTLKCMSNLALLYESQGRYDEAETLTLQTLKITERVLGEEHPLTLANTTNLGRLYNSMERFEEAAALFEVSLPLKRRVLGMQHPWTGYAMTGLVTAYLGLGRTENALPLQRELIALRISAAEDKDASDNVLNAAAWTLLTVEEESLRDPERALGFAQRACALAEEASSDQLWTYLDTLALAQHRTGDSTAAVETQKRAIALMPEDASPEMAQRLAEYEAALKDR